MDVITDPGRGAWLHGRVGDGRRPDHLVPSGYPAAVRVLHECALVRDGGDRGDGGILRLTWLQAAVLLGRRVEEGMTWAMLTGSDDNRAPLGPGLDLVVPEQGHLPPAVLATVVRTVTGGRGGAATGAIWTGWSDLHPRSLGIGVLATGPVTQEEVDAFVAGEAVRIEAEPQTAAQAAIAAGRTLELPNREFLLLELDLTELLDPAWVRTAGLGWTPADDLPSNRGPVTPNLLWPDDRSWFLTCEIDDPFTTVVGPQELTEALHADPRLETMRVPAPRRG